MALETFARQSLAQFVIIYGEIFDGKAIKPSELETLMWGRMCAKEANINKLGFKIPYDNIRRSKVTLPYLPDDINYTGCPVIKKNGGLYTPCCGKIAEDAFYCKSCSVDKEGNAKDLEFGTTETRDAGVEDELFAPITFGEWMKGHKMTLSKVYANLAAAGVQIEIPAEQLVCRELPKRRKGRPAKSEDSVVDEDTVKPKRKAKKDSDSEEEKPKEKPKKKASPKASPAASESETEKPKKATKAKKVPEPEPESESEEEAPPPKKASKASPKTSPAASESETEKPKKKTKVPEPEPESESEEEAPAPKKVEKPKETKAKEPKVEKPKEPKAEKPAKEPKKEAKAEKPKEPKAEKPKKESKAAKEEKPKKKVEPEPEELDVAELAAGFAEDEENEDVEATIDDVDYIIRNGKYVCSKEDGTILGTVDGDEVVWNSEKR